MIFVMCAENVDSDCSMLCSSPMSAMISWNTGMVKVKVITIEAPGASVSVVEFAPLVLIVPPAVPTTRLPVTLAAVLVPLLL